MKSKLRKLFVVFVMLLLATGQLLAAPAGNVGSLQFDGESATPDTTTVTVWFYDSDGNVAFASDTDVPSGEEGYAVGCIFIDTDASGTSILLTNQGTTSSCNFASGSSTTTFTALTDTPGSITANTYYVGNSGGTALEAGIVIGTSTATSGNVLVGDGTDFDSKTPDNAGLIDKSSEQANIAGAKTWTGTQTYTGTTTFQDSVTYNSTTKAIFNAATEYIYSSASGILNLAANTEFQIDTALFDVNLGANGLDVDSTGVIDLTTTKNSAAALYFHANGGTSEAVKIHSDQGTGASSVQLLSDVGSVDIDAGSDDDVTIDGGQVKIASKQDVAEAISLTVNQGTSETITIINTQGTDAGAITATATAGGVDIDAAATKDVDISGGQVLLSSKDDTASAIALTANQGTSETIVATNTQGTAEGAITLTSTAGGVDIDGAAAKNVDIAGGQVLISSKDNAASAIALTANQGTSETIVVTNTQGTDDAAINLTATAGGVYINGQKVEIVGSATAGAVNYLHDTGGDDTYAVALDPEPSSLVEGTVVYLNVDVANTGACSLDAGPGAAVDIKNCDGNDPANGDIATTGVAVLVYNGTNWILTNPVNGH